MRRTVLVVLALVTLVPLASAHVVRAEDAAEQAAREIADARERANAAADAYFAAESRLDTLDIEAQLSLGHDAPAVGAL